MQWWIKVFLNFIFLLESSPVATELSVIFLEVKGSPQFIFKEGLAKFGESH